MLPGVSIFMTQTVVPGSNTYTTAGTYSFQVPLFNTMTVELWGAGGAGGGYQSPGSTISDSGTASTFYTASAPGGGGGQSAGTSTQGGNPWGVGGAGGSPAVGNVTATNGNAGGSGPASSTGAGAPNGGGDAPPNYTNGTSPGGGGSGFFYSTGGKFPAVAGGGGSGAYAKSIFTPSALSPGTILSIVVGTGGPAPSGYAGKGADGKIIVTWS